MRKSHPLKKFPPKVIKKLNWNDCPVEVDIGKRWESGMDHHPYSYQVRKLIRELDKEGNWKFGGDGDNGEEILYYLDIFFEIDELPLQVKRKWI